MGPGVRGPLLDQATSQTRLKAAREGDHAIRVPLEQLEVDARLATAEAFEEAGRGERDQVAKAGVGGGQQGEVVALTPPVGAATIVDQVGLEADDRLDPVRRAGLVVLDGAVHDPVIGEPQRRHPQLRGPGRHATDLAGAVEQRVLAVDMQVDRCAATSDHFNRPRCHRPAFRTVRGFRIVSSG